MNVCSRNRRNATGSMLRGSTLAITALLVGGLSLTGCDFGDDEEESEPQKFEVTITNTSQVFDYFESGVFNTPDGETEPGPLFPGGSYSFMVHAAPGHKLSFATMMVQSNDLFYAPAEEGIALYDEDGMAVTGDITDLLSLWDAGTEINQEPGTGADQAPSQSGPNTGADDPDDTVRPATDDWGNLPTVADVLSVDLAHDGVDGFTVTVTNVSDENTLTHSAGSSAVPIAPGAWVVHDAGSPLFMSGSMDAGNGLEALAEDGDPSGLASYLAMGTGLTQIFAPGIWAVDTEYSVLFEADMADAGLGLENLAEDGDPSVLLGNISSANSGVFTTPEGASEPGVLLPGSSYTFEFEASPGEMLHIASMLVQSNDLFVSPDDMGIELFDADDNAISGEVVSSLSIWDAGTEVNQRPGTGSNQAPRQSGANTGDDEGGLVMEVADMYEYPAVDSILSVSIQLAD